MEMNLETCDSDQKDGKISLKSCVFDRKRDFSTQNRAFCAENCPELWDFQPLETEKLILLDLA